MGSSHRQEDLERGRNDLLVARKKTDGLTRTDGFFPFYWDANEGKVWLEIDRFGERNNFV